jgi:primase-polymerase (primpol)-like protein
VLKGIPNWLVWKYTWNPKKKRKDGSGALGEWDKPPFNARTGALADTTNPATWCDFDTAWAAYQSRQWNGIGIVLTEEVGIVGIDLDRCVNDATDVIDDWAQEIIDRIDSYTEISPSGTGVRILAHGRKPAGRCVKGSFEIYGTGRYLTITGHHLPSTPTGVEERPEQIAAVWAGMFGQDGRPDRAAKATSVVNTPAPTCSGPPAGNAVTPDTPGPIKAVTPDTLGPTNALTDDEIIRRAKGAQNGDKFVRLWDGNINGYKSDSEADLALCGMLAFWTGPDLKRIDGLFRKSGLMRPKWDERRGESTYGARTIAKALEGRTEFHTPRSAIKEVPPGSGLTFESEPAGGRK